MMSDEIAKWCGYQDAYDMLVDHWEIKELLQMLREYVYEFGTVLFDDIIEEIASDKFDCVDWERIKADADDAKYEAYRDGEL